MASQTALARSQPSQQLPIPQDGSFEGLGHSLSTSSGTNTQPSSHVASPSASQYDVDQLRSARDSAPTSGHATPSARADSDLFPGENAETAPMPPRPGRAQHNRRTVPIPAPPPQVPVKSTSTAETVAENRRQNMDVPAAARVYPNGNVADFSPWKGKHLEDSMSESTIKSGFQNKPLITNESNTARPALWSHLKNKGGPQTLSSLFVSVMDKRQASARITGPSTFKPPPRVTMSNSRREAFLQELANPSWPMRKLNRSVPHTISGRVLLDQCLNKNIPIPRAIWLAKCIGANDFRAFKRKVGSGSSASSSEAKWIRDWTIHVEQFLHTIITGVGEAEWKHRVDYAIRLTCHLFAENLLDTDHYVDWILGTLETTSTQSLPMWLLLAQIHWSSLITYRKRGVRLARVLLNSHLRLSSGEADDLSLAMLGRLDELIVRLACTNKSSLILAKDWHIFRAMMQSLHSKQTTEQGRLALEHVMHRNDNLCLAEASREAGASGAAKVIHLLDTCALRSSRNQLAEQCARCGLPLADLASTLIRWASSKFRCGRHRIYVVSRILHKLLLTSGEPEILLLDSVRKLAGDQTIDQLHLFQVIVELVRANQFSVGRFVQHLVAIGVTGDLDSNDLLKLLRHLPTVRASDTVINMRHDLLATSVEDQATSEQHQRRLVVVYRNLASQAGQHSAHHDIDFASLTLAQRFDIGYSVRRCAFAIYSHESCEGAKSRESVEDVFFTTRHILESIEDFPCLADVLGICMNQAAQTLLTHVADTLHYNYRCFIGLGAMKSLFDKLMTTYESIRHQQQLSKSFCTSLLSLCTTLDANAALIAQLTQDVFRCEQMGSMAICSPVSDNAGELSQMTGDTDEDIERVLSSGTTMDNLIMHRIFDRITTRFEDACTSQDIVNVPIGQWLGRLREFDRVAFDGMLRSYLSMKMATLDGLTLISENLVPGLISSSCMNLAELHAFVLSLVASSVKSDPDRDVLLKAEILRTMLPDQKLRTSCPHADAYKFRLDQMIYAAAFPATILDVLSTLVLYDRSSLSNAAQQRCREALSLESLRVFLLEYVNAAAAHRHVVADVLSRGTAANLDAMGQLVSLIMINMPAIRREDEWTSTVISALFACLDDLSLVNSSIAFAYVQRLLAVDPSRRQSTATAQQLASTILDAVLQRSTNEQDICMQLLSALDNDIKNKVAHEAELRLLSDVMETPLPETLPTGEATTQLLLRIFERTCVLEPLADDAPVNALIVDKLRQLVDFFSPENTDGAPKKYADVLMSHAALQLHILLRLIAVRKQGAGSVKTFSDEPTIIFCLLILLQLPLLQRHAVLINTIFDTAALLIEDLSDEQQSLLDRFDSHRLHDPRINFLLGTQVSTSADSWLGLSVSQLSSNAGSTTTVTAPPALARTPLAQGQGSSQPSPRTPQRPPPLSQPSRTPSSQQGSAINARSASSTMTGGTAPKAAPLPTQFPLKHWELLPDQGNASVTNDTAISLAIFGTRRV